MSGHGVHRGEEDRLHLGEPLTVARRVLARLCMSVAPGTGAVERPYVLIGNMEHMLSEAETLGAVLAKLARIGAGATPP